MNTKQHIIHEALTLFSLKGYYAVNVNEIAEAVGIKAPSLYKHFKSKKDIFNAVIEEMNKRYLSYTSFLHINGENTSDDTFTFANISEKELIDKGISLFSYFLHDEYISKFRKMLNIEKNTNKELSLMFVNQYINEPLSYQSMLMRLLSKENFLKKENPDIMALHFYSPIFLLLNLCDSQPEREIECINMLTLHIKQFNRFYKEVNR